MHLLDTLSWSKGFGFEGGFRVWDKGSVQLPFEGPGLGIGPRVLGSVQLAPLFLGFVQLTPLFLDFVQLTPLFPQCIRGLPRRILPLGGIGLCVITTACQNEAILRLVLVES